MLPGEVSSQYVTALMLIAPYLPGGITLALTTPLVSRPYVEITAAVMRAFGVPDVDVGERRINVGVGAYLATDFEVEPDASSASYPLAAAAIAGGAVCVRRLGTGALQGDARFVDLLAAMGCTTSVGGDTVVIRDPRRPLRGLDVDMADISDLVPTMAVVATQAVTPTRITGVGFIRAKESDRLGDLAGELRRLGADVDVLDDGLEIRPTDAPLRAARVATHHDHRLAMAFGVLGLAVDGIEIESPGVVSKSWPDFWGALDEWTTTEPTM
jgi:3-phosphoshikimate 1-carboxyvinyltransferase